MEANFVANLGENRSAGVRAPADLSDLVDQGNDTWAVTLGPFPETTVDGAADQGHAMSITITAIDAANNQASTKAAATGASNEQRRSVLVQAVRTKSLPKPSIGVTTRPSHEPP